MIFGRPDGHRRKEIGGRAVAPASRLGVIEQVQPAANVVFAQLCQLVEGAPARWPTASAGRVIRRWAD